MPALNASKDSARMGVVRHFTKLVILETRNRRVDKRSASTGSVIPDARSPQLAGEFGGCAALIHPTKSRVRQEDKNHQARRTPMLAISSIALRAAFCIVASHDRNDGMRFGSKANGRRI